MHTEAQSAAILETDLPVDVDTDGMNVLSSYNGSNVVFRLLRIETWGSSLINLGYYPFPGILGGLNLFGNSERAQQRLVVNSIGLLDVGVHDRVLDVACGRGESSFIAQCMHPHSTVLGVDLLEDHVQVAQTLFHGVDRLSYQVGNAEQLEFANDSFDRVICIEAAFHFPDRAEFLNQAYRVLRPGGKMVVIDFAWNSEADRIHRHTAETKLVREIWQWEDFYSKEEYEHVAKLMGFRIKSSRDWTPYVTGPLQNSFECLSLLGNSSWGRRILEQRNPLYRSFSIDDWKDLAQAVRAHRYVQSRSKYMAFVLEKPTHKSVA